MINRTVILRLIAGAYLAYLGYQLLSGYISGAETGNPMVSLIGGGLFVIIAIVLIINSIKLFMKDYKEFSEVPADAEETDEDAEAVEEIETDEAEVVAEVEAEETAEEEEA